MPAEVWIDDEDVTDYSIEGSVTKRLNRIGQAQVKIPSHHAPGAAGSLLKIEIDGDLWFHGRALVVETSADEDSAYTVYNASDPFELWQWRPVRDADGDFSNPSIIQDFVTGPQIIEQMIINSEDSGDVPDDAEGDLRLELGSFATGGVDLTGAPTDWPMTMAQLMTLLVSTGELDVVLTPVDTGSDLARVDAYNGDFGTDLSGSLIFEYGMGLRNIRNLRWNEDMTDLCNKLWYYLGPRVATAADPGSEQHWRRNITGGALMPDPPQSTIDTARFASRATYDVRMDIKIFDAQGNESGIGSLLYERLWQIEQWLRQAPRTIVHITPTRETEIGSFDLGDLVTVRATPTLRGGFDGVQRIYEYTVSWADDGVLALSELQTSPNNEGI